MLLLFLYETKNDFKLKNRQTGNGSKKNFMDPFLGLIGFNCFKAVEPLRGNSLVLTT